MNSPDTARFTNSGETATAVYDLCFKFVKERRNFKPYGHERKYMYAATCPFTDMEGLRFGTTSKNQFDYLKYAPTPGHLFLDDGSIQAFERYVDYMFNEDDKLDDWSYFKILNKLSPEDFKQMDMTVKKGRFNRTSADSEFRVPISLIPIAEYMLLEQCSQVYSVKSINECLEKSQLRIRLNTYFHSLLSLLKCSEEDIVEVLYRKGVLPSRNFQLISTQKELMIATKRFRSSGLKERLETHFKLFESTLGMMKPKYGLPHSNLCQALCQIFVFHPLYSQYQKSLLLETRFIGDGKGYLANAVRNRKRKSCCISNSVATTQTQEDNILAQAMVSCLPEIYLPPGKQFLTVNIDQELVSSGVAICLLDETTEEDDICEYVVSDDNTVS